MKKYFFIFILLFVTSGRKAIAQATFHPVTVNTGVDTSNAPYKGIYKFWAEYLNLITNHPDTTVLKDFWAASEISKYKSIDLISSDGFFSQPFYTFPTRKLILSITKTEDSIYTIKTVYYFKNEHDAINVLAIVNVGVAIIKGQYKLINYLSLSTRDWKTKDIGHIHFLYKKDYDFNLIAAQQSADFLDSTYHVFNITPRNVLYIAAASCDETKRIRGYDYLIGMGGDKKVCGVFDPKNFIAYCGGLGEYYPHELVHVINVYFPKSHDIFLGGLTGLWGGHFGKPIIYHAKRVVAYLDKNKIRKVDPLTFKRLDDYTNPTYVTGALLCKKILEKGGVPLLEKAMGYGTSDADFYLAIRNTLGIDKEELPKYMTRELHRWVKENK